jgi:hypothetical protein
MNKQEFIKNWLKELKKQNISYNMKRKGCSFSLEWKDENSVWVINSKKNRMNTLSIDTIKRLFETYNGKNIDYHKAGLYGYFSPLISSLYNDYSKIFEPKETFELKETVDKNQFLVTILQEFTKTELISKINLLNITKTELIDLVIKTN